MSKNINIYLRKWKMSKTPVAICNFCRENIVPVMWESIITRTKPNWDKSSTIMSMDDFSKFAQIPGTKILIILGTQAIVDPEMIAKMFDGTETTKLIIIPITNNSEMFRDLNRENYQIVVKYVPRFEKFIRKGYLKYDSVIYPINYLLNIIHRLERQQELFKLFDEESHCLVDNQLLYDFSLDSYLTGRYSKYNDNPEEDIKFFGDFFCRHARKHAEKVYSELGYLIPGLSSPFIKLPGDIDGDEREMRSVKCTISRFIRSKNKEMVEKICKVAAADPERNYSDLDLIIFSEPDDECLEIAKKYGYYVPETIEDLRISTPYISYSEARAVFKHGTLELKRRLVNFLFPAGGIPHFNCNVAAIYDVFLEIYPEDQNLRKERESFIHNDEEYGYALYFKFDFEDFQYTHLYKKLKEHGLL